jgi:NAD(P)-dependent dehydrogenase (short-subunit alcohol dehydrogenase family)
LPRPKDNARRRLLWLACKTLVRPYARYQSDHVSNLLIYTDTDFASASMSHSLQDQSLVGHDEALHHSLQNTSSAYSWAISSIIRDLQTWTSLVTPYVFHPVTAAQVYFPNMWPFSGKSFDPDVGIGDLSNKVILVTGANTGIGKETVLQLAKHNPAKLYLAARTEAKARDAIKSIKSAISKPVDIEYLPLDLASLKSVREAAERVNASTSRLDILILNAGIMAVPPGKSESGHDIQLGTNHIGHFQLTKLLLPLLERTAAMPGSDVRVISVSSEAYNMAPPIDTITSTEKLTATGPWTRYGASKAANILFAAELARRYPAFKSVSLHPGMIKTDLYLPNQEINSLFKYGLALFSPLVLRGVPEGAQNQLWAAAGAKREELIDGAYYTPVGKSHAGNKFANDQEGGKRLWDWTEAELKKAGA